MKVNSSSPIKSIQRGNAYLTGSASLDVTISNVNLDKSFVTASPMASDVAGLTTARLTNESTITIQKWSGSSTYTGRCYWEVIEYV